MIKKILLNTVVGLIAMLALFMVVLSGCENTIIYHPVKYPEGLWDTSQMPLQSLRTMTGKTAVSVFSVKSC